jgi:hypothetical protein
LAITTFGNTKPKQYFLLSFGNNMSNVANKVTNTIHIGFFKEFSSSILLIYSAFLFPLMLVFFRQKNH